MEHEILIALIGKMVDERLQALPVVAGPRGPRGLNGLNGKDFVFEENECRIRAIIKEAALKFEDLDANQIESLRGPRGKHGRDGKDFVFSEHEGEIRAWAKEFALKFEDLSHDQIEAIRGPRGRDGRSGSDGRSFIFEEHRAAIESIIQSAIGEVRHELKLKFADLTADEIEQIRGPRGRDGRDGKNFEFDEHKEYFDSLKPKFSDFTEEERSLLRLKFSDLTEEQKDQLKIKFSDLSDEDRASLRGPRGLRGQRGVQGRDGLTGPQGPRGLPGAQGLRGLTGANGRDGADGQDGRDGQDAAYITYVDVRQIKNQIQFVFEFSDGTELVTRKIDLPSNSYVYVAGGSGTVGSGSGSGTGADGKSAYEIAIENGFVGTVTEWLASLVGPQGPKGDPGDSGVTETTVDLTDDVTTPTDVTGMLINTDKSFYVHYYIERTWDGTFMSDWVHLADVEHIGSFVTVHETGLLLISRAGTTCTITPVFSDADAGVIFSITDAGQIQYTSSNIGGTATTFKLTWSFSSIGAASTNAAIVNDSASPVDVDGMVIPLKSNMIHYYIERVTTGVGATELYESGILFGTKTGDGFRLSSMAKDGDAGVDLSVSSGGQVQQTTTNISGTPSASQIYWQFFNLTGGT